MKRQISPVISTSTSLLVPTGSTTDIQVQEKDRAVLAKYLSEHGATKGRAPETILDELVRMSIKARERNTTFYAHSRETSAEIEQKKAGFILDQIPVRVAMERQFGRSFAVLMSVPLTDVFPGPGLSVTGEIEPAWLINSSKYVFDYCIDHGLNPTLEYWDTQNAALRGHNLVVHFESAGDASKWGKYDYVALAEKQFGIRSRIDALAGRDHTILLSFETPDNLKQPGVVTPEELPKDLKALYERYTKAGYFVSLDYWDTFDQQGVQQYGFNFVVNWRTSIKEAINASRPAV
jgi:hypothetical protein